MTHSFLGFDRFQQSMGVKGTIRSVALGWSFTLAVVGDEGELLGWGKSRVLEIQSKMEEMMTHRFFRFSLNFKVDIVSCGRDHVLLISNSGELFSFGWNKFGQCGREAGQNYLKIGKVEEFEGKRITRCSCGDRHSIVIIEGGQAFSFGSGELGQLGLGPLSSSSLFSPLPILSYLSENAIVSLPIKDVACGLSHSLFLSENGQVFSCGWNAYLQLGHGDTEDRFLPELVQEIENQEIIQIAAGGWHSICLSGVGRVFSFGWGEFGALGHGDNQPKDVPTVVQSLVSCKVQKIACGSRHSAFLTDDSQVLTCGFSISEPNASIPWKREEFHGAKCVYAGYWSTVGSFL